MKNWIKTYGIGPLLLVASIIMALIGLAIYLATTMGKGLAIE